MNSRQNESTNNTVRIFQILSQHGASTLTQITERMDLTKGTVHGYLQSLLENGLVTREESRYELSPQFVIYGDLVRYGLDIYRYGAGQVDRLVEETGETAMIMREHDGREVILYEEFGPDAVGKSYYERNKGEPQPLYCTASGKAVLAHLPPERRERIIDQTTFSAVTPNTIDDPDVLRQELEAIRDSGVAFNDEEQLTGLRAVAAPVVVDGDVHGAISLDGPRSRVKGSTFNDVFPELVVEAANIIEVDIRTEQAG
jgi:DNA-binding IclR family transcriptional regulator